MVVKCNTKKVGVLGGVVDCWLPVKEKPEPQVGDDEEKPRKEHARVSGWGQSKESRPQAVDKPNQRGSDSQVTSCLRLAHH